jgi:dipeptidyl aminopeptidase/acylaminoacyl peptidase
LVIVDVETGEISATGVEGVGASWSSDGRFLAFTTEVVRGGSWLYGIPVDGRIAVLDVGTRELIHVTPAGKHVRDEETAKRELQGSLEPVWSPDGQWIAYRKTGYFRANKKAERKRTEETWIVDKEGQGARKVADGFGPVAWAHDSQSLFILKENQIDRVEISSSSSRKLISWEKAQMP